MTCTELSAEGVEVDGRDHKLDIPDIMDVSAAVVLRVFGFSGKKIDSNLIKKLWSSDIG